MCFGWLKEQSWDSDACFVFAVFSDLALFLSQSQALLSGLRIAKGVWGLGRDKKVSSSPPAPVQPRESL